MRVPPVLAVLLVCVSGVAVHAQCRVEGTVRNRDGSPIPGVTVRIDGPDYKQPITTTADAQGHYVFADVRAGTRVRIVALRDARPVATEYALVTLFVETADLKEEAANTTPGTLEYLLASNGPSGDVSGVVRSTDGRPVPAAHIVVGDTPLTTTTDSAGRYVVTGLRPDIQIALHAAASGFDPQAEEVTVAAGARTDVDFTLPARREPDEPGPSLSTIAESADDGRVIVAPNDVTAIGGVFPRDLFRAVQLLPGVSAAAGQPPSLGIRGGTPEQTLTTIDGLALYQSATPWDPFATVNTDAIASAELSKSMIDADEGGRLSAALRMTGMTPRSAGGFVNMSVLGADGLVAAPVGSNASFMLAIRHSPPASLYNQVLDRFAASSGVSARDRMPRFSGGAFPDAAAASGFRDVNGKIDVTPMAGDRVSLTVYDGWDAVNDSRDLTIASTNTGAFEPPLLSALPADAVSQVAMAENWTGRGVSGRWSHIWPASATTTVTVARSEFTSASEQAHALTSASTGGDYSYVDAHGGSAGLSESNRVQDTTVRVDGSVPIGFRHAVSIGGEISNVDASYASRAEATRGPISGPTSSVLTGFLDREASGTLTTGYLQDAWRPSSRLTVTPGLRVTRDDVTASAYFEPRVGAAYQVLSELRVNGGWTVTHQFVNDITREDRLHGDGAFWALSDGVTIPVARAAQAFVGGEFELQGVLVTLDGYRKSLDDVTLFAPRNLPGVSPASAASLLYSGSGTAHGIEALVQHRADRNTVWASYTYSRIEYTFPAIEAGTFFGSNDHPHEFKIVDAITVAPKWSISAAWIIGSGYVYTPATGTEPVWFPSGATVENVTFDAKNSARLPAYHRLDLSTEHDFAVKRLKAAIGASLFNAYNQRNLWFYDFDTAARSLSATEIALMGRAANVFVRLGL